MGELAQDQCFPSVLSVNSLNFPSTFDKSMIVASVYPDPLSKFGSFSPIASRLISYEDF